MKYHFDIHLKYILSNKYKNFKSYANLCKRMQTFAQMTKFFEFNWTRNRHNITDNNSDLYDNANCKIQCIDVNSWNY
jgi:hypothetical protein